MSFSTSYQKGEPRKTVRLFSLISHLLDIQKKYGDIELFYSDIFGQPRLLKVPEIRVKTAKVYYRRSMLGKYQIKCVSDEMALLDDTFKNCIQSTSFRSIVIHAISDNLPQTRFIYHISSLVAELRCFFNVVGNLSVMFQIPNGYMIPLLRSQIQPMILYQETRYLHPKQKKKNGVLVEYRSEKQKSIIGTLVSKPFKGCMFISDCVYHDWEEYL